ncbi:MAG: AAA family ATPase [Bacteroidales bacterium]|nr:AAA family ATPase [Bacteroidales bacterium]
MTNPIISRERMTFTDKDSATVIASKFINQTNRHVFLTGKAGTGKTTFLKYITGHTIKKTIVAAPTGIAAINAGGVTLHSLFQLPFGSFIPSNDLTTGDNITIQLNTRQSLIKNIRLNKYKRSMLNELELLIIDEVSMLRADLLDAIDVVLRYVRRQKNSPFGGIQILFIGDLLQLPPVVKDEEWDYLAPYYPGLNFFNAKALQNNAPLYIELEKIYRQSDKQFISLLNNIRDNAITKEDIELLNRFYKPSFRPDIKEGYINLTTHNRKADEINRQALENLPGKLYSFDAEVDGDFSDNLYPVEYSLKLKKGAQVMFIKNDHTGEQQYFNGKIGIVKDLSADWIEIRFNDGTPPVLAEHYVWENKKYSLNKETLEIEETVTGTFSHYPVKLAWAITVHKSQGLTFQKAIIDVSGAFAPGQIYVALSRLISLDGLVLTAPVPLSSLHQDENLEEFAKSKIKQDKLKEVLTEETHSFIEDTVLRSFNFNLLRDKLNDHAESFNKDDSKSMKQQYKGWAVEFTSDFEPQKKVADRFSDQVRKITGIKHPGYLQVLHERVKAAITYFEPLIKDFSKRVISQKRKVNKQKKMKAYLNELQYIEFLFSKQLQSIHKTEALIKSVIHNSGPSKKALGKRN